MKRTTRVRWRFSPMGMILAGLFCMACSPRAPMAYLPCDSQVVVVIPRLDGLWQASESLLGDSDLRSKLAKELSAVEGGLLHKLALPAPEAGETIELEALAATGIDFSGAAAFAMAKGGATELGVLPVADREAFDRSLRRLIVAESDQEPVFWQAEIEGVTVTMAGDLGSARAKLAWVHVPGFVLISDRAERGRVARYVARRARANHSIYRNRDFTRLREGLGRHQIYLYADVLGLRDSSAETEGLSRDLEALAELGEVFAGALDLSEGRLAIKLRTRPQDGAAKAILGAFRAQPGASSQLAAVADDALFVSRIGVEPKALFDALLRQLSAGDRRELYGAMGELQSQLKLDGSDALLDLFSGQAVWSLHAPTEAIEMGGDTSDWTKAVEQFGLGFAIEVKDTKLADAALAQLERAMVLEGLDLKISGDASQRRYTWSRAGEPSLVWARVNAHIVVANITYFERLLATLAGQAPRLADHLGDSHFTEALTGRDGVAVYFDLGRMVSAVKFSGNGGEPWANLAFDALVKSVADLPRVLIELHPGEDQLLHADFQLKFATEQSDSN